MIEPAPDRWPQTAQLIELALSHDADIARLAGQELIARLDWPAVPLEHNGERRVIRRGAAP